MRISAVLDSSVFNEVDFTPTYAMHTEEFLNSIQKSGLLIVDSENKLQNAIFEQIKFLPTKHQQQLQIRFQELFKNKRGKVVECYILSNDTSSRNLLDYAYYLRAVSKADTLIVGRESLKILKSDQRYDEDIVLWAGNTDNDFEKLYQRFYDKLQSIDTRSQSDMENAITHSTQFNNWLASIVNEEVFTSRERLITLLEKKGSYEALEREFREFFNGYYTLALELEEHEESVLNIIKGTDALAHLKHRVSAVETQRKSSPLGREARRMGMSIHSDPMPKVKVAALSLGGFQTLLQTLCNCRLFVSRNRLVKLMETEESIEIIDRLRIEFYEFFVCYLELELFLEDYDYDPDEGLELRPEFIESLKREDEYIKAGGEMFTLEEVAKRLGI
ncbi:hypothetical protein C6501_05975 [Candidatus Poribacteria bacterium]|nr:MAG: hypothetical protein C6501_05975 [Candidatus Poribacteria bacterium]